ncbi:MAG TPA: dUTP diphosphatase [Candidatus Ozemobacteraceae bacterium]|nr:dUTP diphosphatase [Candidatus Ozemobacteraceae bacterium]
MSDTPAPLQIRLQPAGTWPWQVPARATTGASGYDLCASVKGEIGPGKVVAVPTGIKIEIPAGYEGQVRPRSGLAAKHGVTVLNAPGTIDSDYRGEVKVILINHGEEPFRYEPGMRIAQLVFAKVQEAEFTVVDQIVDSARGEGGFGSTGTF